MEAGRLAAPQGHSAPSRLAAWRFRLLGLSLVALLVGHAAVGGTAFEDAVMGPLGMGFVAALVWAIDPWRLRWPLAALLVAPVLVGLFGMGERWAAAAGSWYHLPLLGVATWAVARGVARAERVDEDVVVGSICTYLLAAVVFAAVYAGLEAAQPGTFALGEASGGRSFGRLLYFSLVTLTTLGFGDVVPLQSGARALVSLESVIGILYPAVVVAWLIGLAARGARGPAARAAGSGGWSGRRYEALAWLLVATLLAGPWVLASPLGRLGFGLLLVAQLLGALTAVGVRGWPAGLAFGLGGAALVGALGPGGWVEQGGLVARTGFFLLTTGMLLRWLARERNVTRQVLCAALAAYLLLGFCLAAAFHLMEALRPGAVAFPAGAPIEETRFVYFAFMTLTTTGFGDVRPAIPAAESLASLGALIGIFYPAVLLARLLSLYAAAEREA